MRDSQVRQRFRCEASARKITVPALKCRVVAGSLPSRPQIRRTIHEGRSGAILIAGAGGARAASQAATETARAMCDRITGAGLTGMREAGYAAATTRGPGLKPKSRANSAGTPASAPEAGPPDLRPRREARTGGNSRWRGAVNLQFAPSGAPPPLILFGGEPSVAFVLAAKLGRGMRRENAIARTFRHPR